jgi:ATP-dependent exoDNAse (exonuclease V) alpha subunit
VVFVGDYRQLPPIGQNPIYSPDASVLAKELRETFVRETIVLHQVMRQVSTEVAFKESLDNLGKGTATTADWDLLMTRNRTQAADRDDPKWTNAVNLAYGNEEATVYNYDRLVAEGKPITVLNAINGPRGNEGRARRAKRDDAGGMSNYTYLCVGSRVMLTLNVWTEAGLHNGAFGTIIDFVYERDDDVANGILPTAIIVEFDDAGHSICFGGNQNWAAISPHTISWQDKDKQWLERTSFPLRLAWGITIHKVCMGRMYFTFTRVAIAIIAFIYY